ncbi:endospore germination permease [Ammoniphilus sp. YIM 78166]|uniref:GerAB/ArcD/ProY family transporter n=1 Tax=Ammoniphilus sp. YIM 78166 TaxID=1644106 RepID=UPI00107017BD|nr:endospore germination permease [Ammoniphilus sp. YIM 78166]
MERISSRQLMIIGSAVVMDATLISVPGQMVGVAGQDAWMGYLFALAVPVVIWWTITRVLKRFPGEDLFSILVNQLPVWGRMLSVAYLLFFFFILVRDLRMLTDFIDISLLQRTPTVAIALLIIVTAMFIAQGGIEIIGRMSEIYQTILILLVFSLPITLARDFDPSELLPFLENGLQPVVVASWYASSYLGEVVVLGFLFASQTVPFRKGLLGIFLGVACLETLIVMNLFVLGAELAPRFVYPNYELVREIRLTDFLDRLDIPIVGVWLPALIIKIGIFLYVVIHGISRLLPSSSPKLLAGPVSLVAYSCSFWFFPDTSQILNFNRPWPVMALFFEFVLPVLLYIILWSKPIKQQNEGRSKSV